ncbi:MAG TPA: hypothetical protein VIF40_18090 [Methylosinus sp.]|jgi:hypothetical protein|uniref:hypothetical protein n=1 Tax=Methylosinus sp. TaxID=427 RepID=UPI002F9495F7
MRGDPRVAGGDLMALRACQYAAAILQKRGALPLDAGAFEARWSPELRTVTFWRSGAFAAAYRIPDRVMDYDPSRAMVSIGKD